MGRRHKTGQSRITTDGDEVIVRPPPERLCAGPGQAVRLKEPVADARGGIGRPWQVLGTLARMRRAGSITCQMHAAGLKFNRLFNLAGLDPLWAPDVGRAPVLTHNLRLNGRGGNGEARQVVLDSLEILGGIQMPTASCAWHCLGLEWTVESWAISRAWGNRRIEVHAATGILLADLAVLQNYYQIA